MATHIRQLRSTTVHSENAENMLAGKGAIKPGAAASKLGVRSALGNIAVNQQRGKPAASGPVKDLIQKPTRLTKQKGTTSLQSLKQSKVVPAPTQQPLRPSLERKAKRASLEKLKKNEELEEEEPMETEQLPAGDVEMADVAAAIVAPVEDIDKDDVGNPQMLPEYVNEIYAYMRILEQKQAVRPGYLGADGSKVGPIKPRMRNFLVDWLIEVHQQFSLIQETLYLTVAVLDRFLQEEGATISTKQLQLVGVTAMLIAAKYEEMYPPEVDDFVYITDKAYKQSEILQMEMRILKTLDFDLGRPLPINFLRRCSKAGLVDGDIHGLAKYVMELTLVDYKFAHVEPSRVSAASLALSMHLLDPAHPPLRQVWTSTLAHYTAYGLTDIEETIRGLAETLLTIHHVQGINVDYLPGSTNSGKKVKAIRAVSKKYCGKKFAKVATIRSVNGSEGKECLKRILSGESV